MKFSRALSLLVAPLIVMGIQIGTLSTAHAAGDADLGLSTGMYASNSAYSVNIYNTGTDDVIQVVLDVTPTNFLIDESYVSVVMSGITHGSNFGSWDSNTSTWSGLLKPSDSITIIFHGDETVPLGSNVSFSSEIVSSLLVGSIPNVDPNTGNDVSNINYTTTQPSDLNISTRLKTTVVITPTTELVYEVTISNDGPGEHIDNGFFQMNYILPEGATFINTTDPDTGDVLDVTGCFSVGPVENLGIPALNTYQYTGEAIVCTLHSTSNLPVGSTYKIEFNLTAGAIFAGGNAEVMALLMGNDLDTYSVVRALSFNEDPTANQNGNFVYLSYDPSALAATASLCPGQPETSIDGTACFRISFNKDIVEETFGIDDIIVSGSGTPSSLTKIADNVWELRISGITLGSSSSISLQTSSILDYSAVESGTSVLGINTIRYEVDGEVNSASGTLAETGANLSLALIAMLLLISGLTISLLLKKDKAKSSFN